MTGQSERVTRAKLVDGKVLIERADGTYGEAGDRTDLARLRALTDAQIERMAADDDTAEDVPAAVRVVRPKEPAK